MIKIVFATVAFALIALGGYGIKKTVADKNQDVEKVEDGKDRGTLKWHARKAKKEGKNNIIISSPIVEYLGVGDSPDFALSNFSLVVAQPVEIKTYPNDVSIATWYKFRTVETISQRPPIPNLLANDPPQDLLPLNDGEFLLPTYGGSVSVDGVNIVMRNTDMPPFSIDKRYLLFISRHPSGFANLWAGPTGAFTITADDELEPVSKKPHPIKEVLSSRFDNSVSKLKQHHVKN